MTGGRSVRFQIDHTWYIHFARGGLRSQPYEYVAYVPQRPAFAVYRVLCPRRRQALAEGRASDSFFSGENRKIPTVVFILAWLGLAWLGLAWYVSGFSGSRRIG